ncbi:MAG: alpha-glucosidase, partial [Blautia sp.]|nr:alpha-glucosidase [Blautia sp.]
MIQKYVYGTPFETEAVIAETAEGKGIPAYVRVSLENGFRLDYVMDKDTVVYGLGENVGGINKRGHLYVSNNSDDPKHT